mgnify:CR=1 FL=1
MKTVLIWLTLCFGTLMTTYANGTAYLFSYFINDSKDGLHLAYSYDGLNWTALNGGKSYLTPAVGKDKLMRDPSICQAPDGTFHMVWTSSWTDRIIGYASSRDLVHWSEQRAIPGRPNFSTMNHRRRIIFSGQPPSQAVIKKWQPVRVRKA